MLCISDVRPISSSNKDKSEQNSMAVTRSFPARLRQRSSNSSRILSKPIFAQIVPDKSCFSLFMKSASRSKRNSATPLNDLMTPSCGGYVTRLFRDYYDKRSVCSLKPAPALCLIPKYGGMPGFQMGKYSAA